jgi:hypothetical protein
MAWGVVGWACVQSSRTAWCGRRDHLQIFYNCADLYVATAPNAEARAAALAEAVKKEALEAAVEVKVRWAC